MTLFETLVTLTLVALLGALAFPAMERAARSLAMAEARVQLVSDLRAARGRAIAQDRIVAVTALPGGQAYLVDGRRHALPQGVTVGAGGDSGIAFHPDGSAAGGTLRFGHGVAAALISADPVTGAIAVSDGTAR